MAASACHRVRFIDSPWYGSRDPKCNAGCRELVSGQVPKHMTGSTCTAMIFLGSVTQIVYSCEALYKLDLFTFRVDLCTT
jgi:hypothetical protein